MVKTLDIRWGAMDKSTVDLPVLIQHFEVHNRTEGKSPRTVDWYNQVLGMFRNWLQANGLRTNVGSIGENEVRQFILYIQGRPGLKSSVMSSHSVSNRVRALRAFFAWLALKGYTEGNSLKDVKSPKEEEQIVEPLSGEEIAEVFSAINSNSALGARNTAIITLMLDTGARLSEAAHLKEQDVHIEDRYVKVKGKGSKR